MGNPMTNSRYMLVAILIGASVLVGCSCQSDVSFEEVTDTAADPVRQNSFSDAVYRLFRLDEFEARRAHEQILFDLNQWIAKQSGDTDWIADPLFSRLPSELTASLAADELARLRFDLQDVFELREAVWMRDVAKSVTARHRRQRANFDSALEAQQDAPWMRELYESFGGDAVEDLLLAAAIFDWTVRNIQLDEMPNASIAEGASPPTGARGRVLQPAFPGPGERMYGWEALLLGHGDALERCKVFVRVARQAGLDVVLLHPDEGAESGAWIAATVIHDEARENLRLYLFDPALGIPIPGPKGQGVATLAQLLAEPELLRQLDVEEVPAVAFENGDPPKEETAEEKSTTDSVDDTDEEATKPLLPREYRYPVEPADLQRLVAWIDAPLVTLSERMRMVERELPPEKRTVLTVSPAGLAKQLRGHEGVGDVRIWTIPYATRDYRRRLSEALVEKRIAQQAGNESLVKRLDSIIDRDTVEQADREFRVFGGLTPLMRGRLLHFRGAFDNSMRDDGSTDKGARAFYLESRPSNAKIEQIRSDPEVQKILETSGRLPKDYAARKKVIEDIIRRKQHASYWLGLVAYETGDDNVAIDFFKTRSLKAFPEGPWADGTRYNLARTYQRQAESDEDKLPLAIELLRESGGAQRHGNLILARQMEESIAEKD
jgi:hypothetical protein